ncbi:hypothetical protein ACWDR1_02025 [Streptosporangium sandarakinum]
MNTLVKAAVVLAAASMLLSGGWAWLDPAGFAHFTRWPDHVHFLHDAGVFQIGIGVMLLCALRWRDAPALVLAGFVVTNTFHAFNHAIDLSLGGRSSDPWMLLTLSAVGLAGWLARIRWLRVAAGARPEGGRHR